MRIAFFGTPAAAVPALEAFLAAPGVEVAAVVTNPDRPSGRGHRLAAPPTKITATAAGITVWQPQRVREIHEDLTHLAVDACAMVAYGALLPVDVLGLGGRGFVNLHFSLLPAWRGAAPVTHTLLAGDTETGVTCFLLERGMDTGPVLARRAVTVDDDETAGELTQRLAVLGAPLLVAAVGGLVNGSLALQAQDHQHASYAPKVAPADARLDWAAPAPVLQRAVRAYNPVPGAWTTLRGERLKIHRARLAEAGVTAGAAVPGQVSALPGQPPVIACGGGGLVLVEVQPAGKPRMAGGDFANGYRPHGEYLG
ncbi:MAG: methionyl-tRNA formyltransferase [Actinomycetota bacterium]|jgi:methionyl-tRNA formyltransferase|nr:methionyl-tRNA formyltransferase [Actinomycetota bacterium]